MEGTPRDAVSPPSDLTELFFLWGSCAGLLFVSDLALLGLVGSVVLALFLRLALLF